MDTTQTTVVTEVEQKMEVVRGELVQAFNPYEHDVTPWQDRAKALTVRNTSERETALAFITETKKAINEREAFFKAVKAPINAVRDMVLAAEKAATNPVKAAHEHAKMVVGTYDREQRAKLEAEQRRIQAEKDAAAEAERQRLLAKAEKERQRADELKTDEAKERARANAESLTAQAAAVEAPIIVLETEKPKGLGAREPWVGEGEDLVAAVQFLAANPLLIPDYLTFNTVGINAAARSRKGPSPVPGVRFYQKTQWVSAKAA